MNVTAGSRPATDPPRRRTRLPTRRWEAADTVIAASVGLVAVIVVIFVMLCIQGYNSSLDATRARGHTAAAVVAEGTRWVISSARTVAGSVANAIGEDAANAGPATLAAFEEIAAALPADTALGIYDGDGRIVPQASSPGAPAIIAATDHFAALAAGAEWTLTAQMARADTGTAAFGVVRRLGTGAIMVLIDAEVLKSLSRAQDFDAGSTVSIVRADGWVIARSPSLPAPLDLAGTAAFDNLSAGATGSYMSPESPADGVSRIVSFHHVDELGYIALASISTAPVLAQLWNGIWIVSLLIAPIALALLVGSLSTARLLRKTEATRRSLAGALAHNDVLFREIHHRVKNNLQSVNSLVQLQPIPREVKTAMNQRIAAMSAVHEHIYRSHTFSRVQARDYLSTLIANLRAGYDDKVEVIEQFEDVAVDADAATPLGLIVNEVVSNAFKHAFADGRAGTITISLVAEEDGMARLTVRDNGVGFDPATPSQGIGRRLIAGLAAQLRGEFSQTNDNGAVFTLVFPTASE